VAITVDRMTGSQSIARDMAPRKRYTAESPLILCCDATMESDFAELFRSAAAAWQPRQGLATDWDAEPARLRDAVPREDSSRCVWRRSPAGRRASATATARSASGGAPARAREWRSASSTTCSQPQARGRAGAPRADGRRGRAWLAARGASRPRGSGSGDARLDGAVRAAVEDLAATAPLSDRTTNPTESGGRRTRIHWFEAIRARRSDRVRYQSRPSCPAGVADRPRSTPSRWQSEVGTTRSATPRGRSPHGQGWGVGRFGVVPHRLITAADATVVYCWLLASAPLGRAKPASWPGSGPFAERCMEWIDRHGDRDGDWLKESARARPGVYETELARLGAGRAGTEERRFPSRTVGTCELMQAYVYGAKTGWRGCVEAWGATTRCPAGCGSRRQS